MKIFGYRRPRDFTTDKSLRVFLEMVEAGGFDYRINEAYAAVARQVAGIDIPSYGELTEDDLADGVIMVAIGGDGTFLEAVHKLRGLPMPVAGVNLGRLGFLATISPPNFKNAANDIRNGDYKLEQRTMLCVTGDFETPPDFPCALNEFTLHRHTADMIDVATYADGHLLAVIRGDGAIVSTPTGSTAYSLSVGGPIVAPHCGCFVCAGIAPHNFSVRPLAVPDTSIIEFEVRTRGREVLASLDNNSFIVRDGARFTIKKSKHSTILALPRDASFYDTLRDKIMWGIDKRDDIVNKF
ncbi:MAG: NAD(+)/NADH kinase [Alistipes sp.]|jgi:NAD+ kinase|nr:NAD(+)/NADH kinase [Alistipes sp.]